MPQNYDRIDLSFSWNGDLEISPNGDLFDTSDDQIEALRQNVVDVVRSVTGDWEFNPLAASDLVDYLGEANSRETAARMRKQLFAALVTHVNIASGDLGVKIVPLNHETVSILIAVSALPTGNNSLEQGQIVFTFVYTYGERGVQI